MKSEDSLVNSLDAFILGVLLGGVLIWVIITIALWNYNGIANETLNDVCHNLTNNNSSVGSVSNGKIVCEIPSSDHTTNIIIKTAGEDK